MFENFDSITFRMIYLHRNSIKHMLSNKLFLYYHWALDYFNDNDNRRKEELVIEFEGLAFSYNVSFYPLTSEGRKGLERVPADSTVRMPDVTSVMSRPKKGNNLRFIKRNKYDWKLALGSKKPTSLRENFR